MDKSICVVSICVGETPAVLDMDAEIGDLLPEGAHASDSAAMILTCPNCATRYFVDDQRIGPAGRPVRCAACGQSWTAHQEAEEPVAETHDEALPDHNPAPAEADSPAIEPEPPETPEPATVETPAHEPAAEVLPRLFRERAQVRKKSYEAAAAGVIWAGLAGVLAVLAGVVLLMRQDIAQIWPKTAGVYAMIGLPVNLVGLTIEDQSARPALKDGHAAVIISGQLRNIRDKAVTAPRLRISLLNPAGHAMAVKIADPGGASIPPGEARRFVVDMLDPPVSATDVEIAFTLGASTRRVAPPPGTPAPAKLSLRGAASADGPPPAQGVIVSAPTDAVEAKPLPANSPYALRPGG